jgi:uncharacterized protein YndB with AHSA1/START domain
MEAQTSTVITVETSVNAPVEKVWEFWTTPDHITKWNHASDDWHSPRASHDLREGGKFSYRMEAKDGSIGFDFGGTFDVIKPNQYLAYTIGDGRKVKVSFSDTGNSTNISESFEAEGTNPVELQKNGWQAILDNFKKYAEREAGSGN